MWRHRGGRISSQRDGSGAFGVGPPDCSDRVGSSADPTLNGHLKYPNNSFMPTIASTSGRLHSEFVRLLFLQAHRETDRFFAASGVQLAQTDRGIFHYRRAAFSSMLKSKVGLALAEAAPLRIAL